MRHIRAGQVYKHYKGVLYAVLAVTSSANDDNTIRVTYMSMDTGKIWERVYDGDNGFTTPYVMENDLLKDRFRLVGQAKITITEEGRYHVERKF